jgi:hypothetical protein
MSDYLCSSRWSFRAGVSEPRTFNRLLLLAFVGAGAKKRCNDDTRFR